MITLPPSKPEPIALTHQLTNFDCGEPSLNEWLKKRALKNHASGASRCFVVCAGSQVLGYYCLSAGAITHALAPKGMRRNMPNPLPVLVLGRLAVDRRYHNQGLGQALLRDAMLRAVNVAGDAGIFALLVHALSEPAKQFYLSRGFVHSPLQPMTLLMTLETIRIILAEPE
ncbi:MAG: GNAT family N-acetyltransferase [Methylomonas sp.]|nr:GNAT family N-acetyltransferase [Methylomonas sp.]PPD22597.1 MAG: GNAT family N-acetyltransferase [Methylomonas sp.]PPD27907.1 MAG: GNAT family N-acetyltransferase [Methylomonas sp.]PPD40017.1 MAG: GNAT family N-acetyltransferase [Methylomonas sp.]PPD41595.1 MAG: GNAT family N-acetyltransferase [Methylomonas sp.]